jgi:hypothetical protein
MQARMAATSHVTGVVPALGSRRAVLGAGLYSGGGPHASVNCDPLASSGRPMTCISIATDATKAGVRSGYAPIPSLALSSQSSRRIAWSTWSTSKLS